MYLRPADLLPRGNKKLTPATGLSARPRTIRVRLRRILIFSVALVLALLTVIVLREAESYRHTGSTARSVELTLAAQDLVHEMQRERGLTNGMLGGDESLRQSVSDQRAATDFALQALNRTLADAPPGAEEVRTALGQFSGITANRGDVDTRRIDRATSFQFYSNAIAALNRTRPGMNGAQDATLWHGLQALHALGDVKEYTAQERGFLNGVFAAGGFGAGEYVQFLDIRAAKQAALTAFERDATSAQRSQLYAAMRTEDSLRAAEAEATAVESVSGPLAQPVHPADWWRQMTSVIDSERTVQRAVGDQIRDRADELRADAAVSLALYLLAALAALAAQVGLILAAVRAIVRPLARVAADADDIASQRLPRLIADWNDTTAGDPEPPEPVRADHTSGEEIISVARALDRVQTTAFELASAQARLRRNTSESMANLARRNQNLVRRQLGLISDFESEELDPDALSKLFELDHLATRMRRNAESLLVLVGESSPRRWSTPIPLNDVIRAGLSEVDDYRRVVLRRIDDVAIAGAHVSEIAHMLAELIENGLSFSPPDLEVEIYGRKLGSRYMLAVVDHGVGMPPDQLATANARLRGEADFLVAPTRFLGHYVVGRLARRLKIEVELTVSPTSGVVARMLLPADLLGDPKAPAPAVPTSDAKHAAGPQIPEPVRGEEGSAGRHRPAHAAQSSDPAAADATAGGTDTGSWLFGPAAGSAIGAVVNGVAAVPARERDGVGTPVDSRASVHERDGGPPVRPFDSQSRTRGGKNTDRQDGRVRPPIRLVPLDEAPIPAGTAGAGPATSGRAYSTAGHHGPGGVPPAHATGQNGHRGPVDGAVSNPSATGGPSVAVGAKASHSVEIDGAAGGVPAVQRTRNGLVKRTRKTRGTVGGGPAVTTNQPVAPLADRSPDEVRSMLAGFRAGHQRGADGGPTRPGSKSEEKNR
ncbi:nitrate- and nitrite sensing domain-containing protein [Nocardia huaxiensis]|uniref:sensor histidine kinase n=1 Tax=Nocardia huaxiensis TaxID=2755382 RepID=UPI001FD0F9E8|nr:nitrate- and nitrite sensing domain-containing protein [Nocardia huaxiensis]